MQLLLVTIIDKITHHTSRIQWGIAKLFYIINDIAELHIITQSDFLSQDLQNLIDISSLMTITLFEG